MSVASVAYPQLAEALGASGPTFSVPDLRGRGLFGTRSRPVGSVGGREQVALNVSHMPPHNHALIGSGGAATTSDPQGSVVARPPIPTLTPYSTDAPLVQGLGGGIGVSGSDEAHENMQPFVVLTMMISTVWQNILPPGSVVGFVGTATPNGWSLCDGSVANIAVPNNVFQGNTPDLRGSLPVGAGQGLGLSLRSVGDIGGSTNVTLATSQMPSHDHELIASASDGTDGSPSGSLVTNVFAGSSGPLVSMNSAGMGLSGGGLSHNNMAPSLVVSYIMSLSPLPPPPGSIVSVVPAMTVADSAGGEMHPWGQTVARADLLGILAPAFQGRAPDARDRFLIGANLSSLDVGTLLGEDHHTLDLSELPLHQHDLIGTSAFTDRVFGASSVFGNTVGEFVYASPSGLSQLSPLAVTNVGSGLEHDNMQPFFVADTILYCSEVCSTTLNNTECVCDLLTGNCVIQPIAAVITVSHAVSLIGNLVLRSNLVIVNTAVGGKVSIQGTVSIAGGSLTVISASAEATNIPIFTASSVVGTFSQVTIEPGYENCSVVQGQPSYSSSSLVILITDSGACGTNMGLIIGLVVGVCVAVAIAAGIGALILKAKSAAAMNKAKSKISASYQTTKGV
jgi:microcystin-dependent protein